MILSIDLGTTFFKFTVWERNGHLKACVPITPKTVSPAANWLELPVETFAAAIQHGIADVLCAACAKRESVEAITFATQTNSFLLLDAFDQPLTPIILWPDVRASDLGASLAEILEFPSRSAITGVPKLTSEFMVAKLLWLSKHRPKALERTRRICLLSDYLTLLMTGVHATEAGTAALTGLVDIEACRWCQPAVERVPLNGRWLPDIVRAGTELGPIRPAISQELSINPNCRFVVGCLDQYAGAIGVGNTGSEMVSETTGTVLSAVTCVRQLDPQPASRLFQGPAHCDGLFWRMTFGSVSANYLQWFRDLSPSKRDFNQLSELAAEIPPGAGGLVLHTDRVPTTLEETFGGWTASHTEGQMVRCIMETVALALREQIAILCGSAALQLQEIRAAGGGARSSVWLQLKADVLGVPVSATSCSEPTSLGAAVFAESSLTNAAVSEIASGWVRPGVRFQPDANRQAIYASPQFTSGLSATCPETRQKYLGHNSCVQS